MDIQNINKLKTWLSNNKVCFVTNSTAMPSSLLVSSLKTYIEYIPIQNFWIIPGIVNNQPFYGLNAFLIMLNYMLENNNFDYVIYIDEDCFIYDFETLIEEFKNFTNSNCCLAGPQDGGAFCHRNHSKLLINTFLSFWNIKMIRDKKITINDIIQYISKLNEQYHDKLYSAFLEILKMNKDLYNFMESSSKQKIDAITYYRITHFGSTHESPYAEVVKDDPQNFVERNQEPYSYKDDEIINFEPYYILEQVLILLTKSPIYYMFGTDLYDSDYEKKNVQFDKSGLTSAIYYGKSINEFDDRKLIAVHTWFSRAYTKWPKNKLQLDHTKRINTIIKEFSRI